MTEECFNYWKYVVFNMCDPRFSDIHVDDDEAIEAAKKEILESRSASAGSPETPSLQSRSAAFTGTDGRTDNDQVDDISTVKVEESENLASRLGRYAVRSCECSGLLSAPLAQLVLDADWLFAGLVQANAENRGLCAQLTCAFPFGAYASLFCSGASESPLVMRSQHSALDELRADLSWCSEVRLQRQLALTLNALGTAADASRTVVTGLIINSLQQNLEESVGLLACMYFIDTHDSRLVPFQPLGHANSALTHYQLDLTHYLRSAIRVLAYY